MHFFDMGIASSPMYLDRVFAPKAEINLVFMRERLIGGEQEATRKVVSTA